MIDRMTKYSFILLSGKAEDFLKDLEGLGVVDITRSEKAVDEVSAADMGRCASLKAAADRLSSLKFDSDPDWEKIEAASFTARPEGDTLTAYQETDRRLSLTARPPYRLVLKCSAEKDTDLLAEGLKVMRKLVKRVNELNELKEQAEKEQASASAPS